METPRIVKMSSLAMALNVHTNQPSKHNDEELIGARTPPNKSPMSTLSNQAMDTNGTEKLGYHLDKFIQEKEQEEDPQDNEISFGLGHSVFQPPFLSQAMVAQDLRTPDIPFIFWATIQTPLAMSLANAMDMMFKALDDFLTKMKDQCFMVFPHNLSHYGTLTNLPKLIEDPEDLPLEADKWLTYFPQTKP